ncbi:ATP-binding cassette, subfamily C, CydC [Phyllobacterium sp. YR620]|uniref:thiol reductant ABC exporter subunit CydC n=1 Tax=Phyllobacterium sp. YR620 TaxID=1881066 RepID=UPI000881A252|nr:thiol reductant ABC exporter subunit CydC [Phyllobacterium sp. YR620]SDP91457.1 ATP-binding cassette, subfamily C, CydC [Phyllobacterium sp. YR620]
MGILHTFRPIIALFYRERRSMLLAGALLAAVTVLTGIMLLGLSGWFITATAIAGLSSATAFAFDVFAPAAAIRFLALARTAARYGERLTTHDATLGVLAGLREQLFRSWSRPQSARLLVQRPSRLLFRLTADIDALDSLYLRVLVPAAVAIVTALAVALTFGMMHPLVGLAAGAFLLLTGLGVPVIAARFAGASSIRRAHALEALRSRSIDLVAGQTDLLMTGPLAAQVQAVAAADRRAAAADRRLNWIEVFAGAGLGVASSILLGGTLIAMAALASVGTINGPVAALGVLVALAALEPFAALRRGAVELGRTLLAARRIGPSLAPPSPPLPRTAARNGEAVGIANARVTHDGAPLPALHALNFTVADGERVALIGPSGAGKSTLLALIAGELGADRGGVATAKSALLTQRTELFQDTLRDNLRLAAPEADDAQLHRALDQAGLNELIASLPAGLGTSLGEGGLGLSGGQSRRLALARLLLRDAPLWLLDEPTEGLDGATARDVLQRLRSAMPGHALVIATHIRREAELADRIIILEHGLIVAALHRGEKDFNTALAALRPD